MNDKRDVRSLIGVLLQVTHVCHSLRIPNTHTHTHTNTHTHTRTHTQTHTHTGFYQVVRK